MIAVAARVGIATSETTSPKRSMPATTHDISHQVLVVDSTVGRDHPRPNGKPSKNDRGATAACDPTGPANTAIGARQARAPRPATLVS
jgi:hypothetical protein